MPQVLLLQVVSMHRAMLPTRLKGKHPQPVRDKQGREVVHAHGLTPVLEHAHGLTPYVGARARVARVGVVHTHGLTPMLVHAHRLHVLGWCTRTVARVCWCTRTGCTCMLAHAHGLTPMVMPPGLSGAPGVDAFVLMYHCAVLCWLLVDLRLAMTFHHTALRCTAFLALQQNHSETVSCRH